MEDRLTKEQKNGILYLLFSKTFERLTMFMVFNIFLKYLTNELNIPDSEAAAYNSLFYGVIGISILTSGAIGDRINRNRFVGVALSVITLMYLFIIILPEILVLKLITMAFIALAVGITIPNFTVLLGNVYNEREFQVKGLSGFILLSISINIGVLIAPFISDSLILAFGYKSVFIASFIFSVIALLFFYRFRRVNSVLDDVAEHDVSILSESAKKFNRIILLAIFTLSFFVIFLINQQHVNFINITYDYLRGSNQLINDIKGGRDYFITLFYVIIIIALFRFRKLNWKTIFNLLILGISVVVISYLLVALLPFLMNYISGKIIFIKSMLLMIFAESIIFPLFLYIVYRTSPSKHKGLFQGIYYLVAFFINMSLIGGMIIYNKLGIFYTYLIFASVLLICVVSIICLAKYVNRYIR